MTNVAEILKNVPKGIKLYSPLIGEVKLDSVENNMISVTPLEPANDMSVLFYENGRYFECWGECMLFPSKENRDWSTFKAEHKFKKGDFVYLRYESGERWLSIFNFAENDKIFSFVNYSPDGDNFFIDVSETGDSILTDIDVSKRRLATEEEKKKLLDAIDKEGYIWDEEKLELRKKPHEFKPFDKVLCRNYNSEYWCADLFSNTCYIDGDLVYVCSGGMGYSQCIPYKGNENLVGTENKP